MDQPLRPADPAAAALISLRRLLDRSVASLSALPYVWLCLAAAGAAVAVSGVWTTPALNAVWMIASDITRDPFPASADADWLLTSWLTPSLAWLFGAAATSHTFALFCAGLLAACYTALCLMFRRLGEPTARILVLAFAASPLTTVMLTWIGYGDPLTVALTTAILVLPRLPVKGACAMLLAANHAEQAAVLLTICLLLVPCLDGRFGGRDGWRLALTLVAGGLAGWGAVHAFQAVHGIMVERSRLDYMLQVGIDIQLTQLVRNPQMLFWSFFGAGWLLVVPAAMAVRHRGLEETGVTVRPLPRLVIAALICMGVTAVMLDSTRVFGLLSWPVLVTLLVLAIRRGAAPSLTWLASAAFLLSLMLPRTVVWDGHVHGGTAAYSLAWMLEKSGAAPGILPESVLAPFRESPENRIKFSALLPDGGPAPLVGRGAPLFFTMAAGGGAALREGWSRPEPWGTWSESPVAKLRLNLSAEAAAAGALDAQVAAFVGNSGMPQQVEVTVDGQPVATWTLTRADPHWQQIPLPAGIAPSGGAVNIGFVIPTARSPSSEGQSTDARLLGLGLVAIRVADDRQP